MREGGAGGGAGPHRPEGQWEAGQLRDQPHVQRLQEVPGGGRGPDECGGSALGGAQTQGGGQGHEEGAGGGQGRPGGDGQDIQADARGHPADLQTKPHRQLTVSAGFCWDIS